MDYPFFDVAQEAVAQYDLLEPELKFLQHSDTVSYKVETEPGDNYLLSIHVPITQEMGNHGADEANVRSSLQWLEALCRETDLVLQTPKRNKSGELVTRIWSLSERRRVNCSMRAWLPGSLYMRTQENEDTAGQIGRLVASLHYHASQWHPPVGFVRPKRDASYFLRMLEGLRPAVMDGRIGPNEYVELSRSVEILLDILAQTPETRQQYGIMHADIHKGNMILFQGQIHLIDFSFCSFGNYMFDLGIVLADMKRELHPVFMENYAQVRSFPQGYKRLIEGFFVGGMVGTFCYWINNPAAQEALARKVPQIAWEYASRFNRDEPFWFE
jgi:Ser/Thr protein kinase RdoA (MazF antagonist)